MKPPPSAMACSLGRMTDRAVVCESVAPIRRRAARDLFSWYVLSATARNTRRCHLSERGSERYRHRLVSVPMTLPPRINTHRTPTRPMLVQEADASADESFRRYVRVWLQQACTCVQRARAATRRLVRGHCRCALPSQHPLLNRRPTRPILVQAAEASAEESF